MSTNTTKAANAARLEKRAKIQVHFKPKDRKIKPSDKEKVKAATEWVLKTYPTVIARLAL